MSASSRQLGIGRYETAFQMLHKLRSGLVDPDREPLKGDDGIEAGPARVEGELLATTSLLQLGLRGCNLLVGGRRGWRGRATGLRDMDDLEEARTALRWAQYLWNLVRMTTKNRDP